MSSCCVGIAGSAWVIKRAVRKHTLHERSRRPDGAPPRGLASVSASSASPRAAVRRLRGGRGIKSLLIPWFRQGDSIADTDASWKLDIELSTTFPGASPPTRVGTAGGGPCGGAYPPSTNAKLVVIRRSRTILCRRFWTFAERPVHNIGRMVDSRCRGQDARRSALLKTKTKWSSPAEARTRRRRRNATLRLFARDAVTRVAGSYAVRRLGIEKRRGRDRGRRRRRARGRGLSDVVKSQGRLQAPSGGVVAGARFARPLQNADRWGDALARAGVGESRSSTDRGDLPSGLTGALLVGVRFAQGMDMGGRQTKPVVGSRPLLGHIARRSRKARCARATRTECLRTRVATAVTPRSIAWRRSH